MHELSLCTVMAHTKTAILPVCRGKGGEERDDEFVKYSCCR